MPLPARTFPCINSHLPNLRCGRRQYPIHLCRRSIHTGSPPDHSCKHLSHRGHSASGTQLQGSTTESNQLEVRSITSPDSQQINLSSKATVQSVNPMTFLVRRIHAGVIVCSMVVMALRASTNTSTLPVVGESESTSPSLWGISLSSIHRQHALRSHSLLLIRHRLPYHWKKVPWYSMRPRPPSGARKKSERMARASLMGSISTTR